MDEYNIVSISPGLEVASREDREKRGLMRTATSALMVVAVVLAVTGPADAFAGSISETSLPWPASGHVQMRYYGGPKSPMWAVQPSVAPADVPVLKSKRLVRRLRGRVALRGLSGCRERSHRLG